MDEINKENKDEIKELSHREQARDKLPIFFGSRDNYIHGFKELVNNANDEVTTNFSKGIVNVFLDNDLKTITVSDTGRGMPIGGSTNGKPNYVLLFETLFAGTNYENNQKGQAKAGTNGVGATVLNYTSEYMKVVVYNGGKKYSLLYENGGELQGEMLVEDSQNPNLHGTSITFRLDPEMYTNTVYNPDELKLFVKRVSSFSNKVTFKFTYNNETEVYHYDSPEEYFENEIDNLTCKPVFGPVFEDDREDEVNKIQILFGTSPEPNQQSFLNYNWLPENGTIHDGIMSGIRNYVNRYALNKKLIDKKSNILVGDIEDSVSYIASVLSTNVEYANQTKLSTDKKLYRYIASDYVKSLLEAFEAEQPKEFDKFVKHIVEVNKFNNKNTAAKQKLKKALNEKVDTINNRVEKLTDCDVHGPDSEIYIAEGDSAMGSVVLARDSDYQAAYALRGKILNCLKADLPTIFKNAVITDLIKILGCGIEVNDKKNKDLDTFNINNMNYGRVIIATDADPDGEQIACLIITMIYRLMPTLINEGRVFIAKTPLYKVKHEDDTMTYFFNEKQKDEELPKIKGKYTISHCKGLGELDAKTMAYTAMDKNTRELVQVDMVDAKLMIDAVEMFMGTDIKDRKEYIENNLDQYISNAE